MNTEEKARAYDEALEDIRAIYPNLKGDAKLAVEHAFPELAESEDERNWKSVERAIRGFITNPTDADELLAWLEKQKEVGIKWFKSDNVKNPEKPYIDKAGMFYTTDGRMCPASKIEKQKEPHYTKRNALFDKCVENCDPEVMKEVSDKVDEMLAKEQKPVEEQDLSGLNDLERVIHRGFLCAGVENVPVTLIKETAQECLIQMKPAEWSEEDEAIRSWCISDIERAKYCKSQTKPELCDIEINWLKNLTERFNPQPKQEWSEEDRDAINGAIGILLDDNNPNFVFPEHSKLSVGEIVKRLKSLCPPWKPNNEQMKALHAASSVSSLGEYVQTHLWSLYNDLQKLM